MYQRVIVLVNIFVLYGLLPGNLYSQKKVWNVAVINFQNNTGNKGLDFLSSSIAENISSTLSRDKTIKLTERTQLSKILSEIELQQSGLFEQKAIENAALLKADYLVIGSYTGKTSKLLVTMRMVDVQTSVVLASKTITESVDNLFEKLNYEASTLFTLISGAELGTLSISSQPEGASIFIDGNRAGTTPSDNIQLTSGTHQVKIKKEGYEEYSETVTIKKEKNSDITALLSQLQFRNQGGFQASIFYLQPSAKILKPSVQYDVALFYNYRFLRTVIDFSYTKPLDHSYKFDVPYSTIEDKRSLRILSTALSLQFQPFNISQYAAPYGGAFVSYSWIKDIRLYDYFPNSSLNNELLGFGPLLGVTFLPYGTIKLFLEGRGSFYSEKIDRHKMLQIDMGGKSSSTVNSLGLTNFTLGGGFGVQI